MTKNTALVDQPYHHTLVCRYFIFVWSDIIFATILRKKNKTMVFNNARQLSKQSIFLHGFVEFQNLGMSLNFSSVHCTFRSQLL